MLRLETQLEYGCHHWFLSRTEDQLVTGNRQDLNDMDGSLKSHGFFEYGCEDKNRYLLCPLASWSE